MKKIYLENVNLGSSSGPNSFANKLLPHLVDLGHSFTSDHSADVSLCFIEAPYLKISSPRVLRLDGIYFNLAQPWKTMNENIERTYRNSSGIVFQSNFCKRLIEKYFGQHDNGVVIHNGASIENIDSATPMVNERYENIWCCASSWRPHKRLSENVGYFLEHKGDNDLLIVAGEVAEEERIREPSVVYFGHLNQMQLYSLYKSAKYFIHLAWLDHCPNVVVDARASGCHIICSSSGGTSEIAGTNSTIIMEDEWDFEPTLLYEPPTLDYNRGVKNKINSCYNMREVAGKYSSFLEKQIR